MQICRNCDNLWWRPNMHSVTYTPRGQRDNEHVSRSARASVCVFESVFVHVCLCVCVCAKRSSRRDVEFIDDDFAAIPLPSFGRRLRERGCRRGWGTAGRLQLSERPTSDRRFGYAFTHALTFFSPIHFEFLFLFLAYIVGRLLRLFLMCVRHLSASLSCLAAAMATTTGQREQQRHRHPDQVCGMGCNFISATWQTQSASVTCVKMFSALCVPNSLRVLPWCHQTVKHKEAHKTAA